VAIDKSGSAPDDPVLVAALHAYNNDARLLRAAIVAAGGVLVVPWTGSVPVQARGRAVPIRFKGTITVRLDDVPDDTGLI
jgi:hypothetical protein